MIEPSLSVDLAGEATEDRVVLEQVREGPGVGEVVDRDEVDVRAGCLRGAEDVAPDPSEAVDADLHSHEVKALLDSLAVDDASDSPAPVSRYRW